MFLINVNPHFSLGKNRDAMHHNTRANGSKETENKKKIFHISHKRFEAARSLKRRSVERRLSFIIKAARENRRSRD